MTAYLACLCLPEAAATLVILQSGPHGPGLGIPMYSLHCSGCHTCSGQNGPVGLRPRQARFPLKVYAGILGLLMLPRSGVPKKTGCQAPLAWPSHLSETTDAIHQRWLNN